MTILAHSGTFSAKYNKLGQLEPIGFNNFVLLLLQDDVTDFSEKIGFFCRLCTFNQLGGISEVHPFTFFIQFM